MIWKRLKNLWKLSAYEPLEKDKVLEVGDKITPLIQPKKAIIIKRKNDPAGEFINDKQK